MKYMKLHVSYFMTSQGVKVCFAPSARVNINFDSQVHSRETHRIFITRKTQFYKLSYYELHYKSTHRD